ncbi:polysaccharide biosynthesis C-terminal domain-containing protein [Flavobacteriales bacterium]|nr:polysaccharide biosynthesis C-terminal domain-containing protein [Flavobacteriales bacterium]
MNPLKKLASQTAIYGLSSVVGRLLNYLLVPLYTRYFLPEEYGVVTELYAYVAFLVIILTYGIETAFFRFSQKEKNNRIVYSTSLISLLFSSLLFIILMFVFSENISSSIGYPNNQEYIKWFALIIGLDAISSISFAKLRALNKATRFALIRLVNIFVNIGLNLFFIIYCPYAIENNLQSLNFVNSVYSPSVGVGYIFIANLFASVITILMLLPEMINSVWVFEKKLWNKMMIYASPLLIAGLAGMTNETIDRILLKYLLPESSNISREIGLYGAFYKLSIIMILFIQTFRFAAEPFYFSQEREHNSRKIYADVMKYFIIVTSFIFLIVTTFYDFFINFLGSKYHDERGFLVVSILLFANFFLGIYYNLSIWYKLTEKTKYGAYIAIFGASITIILNFLLIPVFGFVGSALATLACYFSMVMISFYFSNKHFPIAYNYYRILMYFFLMIFIYLIIYYTNFSLILDVSFLVGYCILVYALEKPKMIENKTPKLF